MAEEKTEQILEHFRSNPNRHFSPGEVGKALKLEPKLVASVVGRLVERGLIARAGRGRYILVKKGGYDGDKIWEHIKRTLTASLGERTLDGMGLEIDRGDLASLLATLKRKLGVKLANNLVREAVTDLYDAREARAILNELGL